MSMTEKPTRREADITFTASADRPPSCLYRSHQRAVWRLSSPARWRR